MSSSTDSQMKPFYPFESLPSTYLSTAYEQSYRGDAILAWSREYYFLSPLFCALYFVMITLGPWFMKNRPAFDLKTPLKYWNLLLAVFSFMGALHSVPHLLLCLWTHGLQHTIAAPGYHMYLNGTVGFWAMLFVYSKYLELIDTLFIILRKKPLLFLHWYHHLTVLFYSWDGYCKEMPTGQFFVAMNYSVHAVMYFYYYLAACPGGPPKWALLITTSQIVQMVIGLCVTLASLYFSFTLPARPDALPPSAKWQLSDGYHNISVTNAYIGMAIYGSYLFLFCQFFVNRYIRGPAAKRAKPANDLKAADGVADKQTVVDNSNAGVSRTVAADQQLRKREAVATQ